jgi:Rieske 2Fe-2S family protein
VLPHLPVPSGLDTKDLAATLSTDFATTRTLPSPAYAADDVLSWERRALFEGGWICLGRDDMVKRPHDQWAVSALDVSVLVTRDEHGQLHAFHNACRHRGHELLGVGQCVNRRHVACPYHSWAFRLDGTLKAATRFSDVPGFDLTDYPLRPMAIAEWEGWVFLNISGDAASFPEWIGNLADLCEAWAPGRLQVQASHQYMVQANWKTIVENYLECYHCPSIHPELCRVSPPDSGVPVSPTGMWIGGHLDLADHAETMSLDGRGHAPRLPTLPEAMARHVYYLALMPNLLISPHPDYVMAHRLEPVSPSSTRVECSWLFDPDAAGRPGFDASYAVDFWDLTNRQDFAACESVTRSIGAGGYVPGPYDYREDAVRTFQAFVARAYRDGYPTPPALTTTRAFDERDALVGAAKRG